jgi:hypothetical protein
VIALSDSQAKISVPSHGNEAQRITGGFPPDRTFFILIGIADKSSGRGSERTVSTPEGSVVRLRTLAL